MKLCYVFHVIGTLTWDHIVNAVESVTAGDSHDNWSTVLYNGGDFDTDDIVALAPFDEVFPYDPDTPKSAAADWDQIAQHVNGHDAYLIHKADFYLGRDAVAAFERIAAARTGAWFAQFRKLNMKERCTVDDLRCYAELGYAAAAALDTTATSASPPATGGKLAVPPGTTVDGVMHGYSDAARPHYRPDSIERSRRWGRSDSVIAMHDNPSVEWVTDDDLVAYHMWHDTPDRADPNKQIMNERF